MNWHISLNLVLFLLVFLPTAHPLLPTVFSSVGNQPIIENRSVAGIAKSNSDNADDLLDCFSVEYLECDSKLVQQDNTFSSNNSTTFKIGDQVWGDNTGPELLYYFDIYYTEEVTITLDNFAASKNFELILLRDCDETIGIAASTNPVGVGEQIKRTLEAGRYYVMVEGKDGTSGTFDLSIDWNCRENAETGPIPIQCGQTVEGSTVGFSNDLTIEDYEECIEFSLGEAYEYNDALYRLDLSEPQFVEIELDILSEGSSLDLLLLESTYIPALPNTPIVGSCLAKGEYKSISERSLFIELEAGTYWIAIDGGIVGFWIGALPPNEGVFRLGLNCKAFPSPCDLNGEFITNGNTVLSKRTAEITTVSLAGIDCIADDYDLSSGVKGHIFTYYSETESPTTIELISDDNRTNLYVYNCSINDRNQACIASTNAEEKKITFAAHSDTYFQLLILTPPSGDESFTLTIPVPDGPCSSDTPELFQREQVINGLLDGAGNDFDVNQSDFFQHCSKYDFDYDGEDRLFQLDFPSSPENIIASNIEDEIIFNDGTNIIHLESASAMGLFLFNYQCGQKNCLARLELPAGGGKDSLFIDELINKPGTYYMVLDKAESEGSAAFTLSWEFQDLFIFCDPDDSKKHTIAFQNNILFNQEIIKPEDRLYIDYIDKQYVGEVMYQPYSVSRDQSGEYDLLSLDLLEQEIISPDSILPNPDIFPQKCGFKEGEAISFRLLKENGLIYTLRPIYDTTSIFASPKNFTAGGVSLVEGFEISNPESLVKVDFEPFSINPLAIPYTAGSFEAHIDVNGSWEIANLPPNDWLQVFDAQTGLGGAPLIQGKGPRKVLVTIAENPEAESRQVVFEIVSEFGLARRVLIRQVPNLCLSSGVDLAPEVTNIACNGDATGAIFFSPEDVEALSFSWGDGIQGPERTNLPAGIYTVTVSDQSGCESIQTFSLSEPSTPLLVDLDVQDFSLCADEVTAALVTVTGGTPEYVIKWNDGATGSIRTSLVAGNYRFTVTDSESCTTVQTFEVDQLPLQSVAIDGNRSICAGDSTELSLDGFQSYLWNNGTTTNSISVKTSGTYSVVVVDQNGCEIEASAHVTMYEKPEPMITGSLSICPGGSTVLSVDEYSSYQWSTGETGPFIQRAVPGPVSVTVTNADGCVGTAAVNIVENEELQPQISGDQEICEGGVTTLDAGAFAGYQWSTGSINRTIPVTASGTYRVTVTDQQGCTGKADFSVTASPLPLPSIIGDTELCFGESSPLSVADDFTTYFWSDNTTGSTIEVRTSGTYRVSVTDEKGCRGEDEIIVFVNPQISLRPEVNEISCFGAADGKLLVEASGGTGTLSYQWEPDLGDLPNPSNLGPGVYNLTVTDENNCFISDTWEVKEPPALDFAIDSIRHETTDSLGFISVSITGGVPPYTFYWSWPGGFRQTNMPNSGALAAGSYTIRVEDANGCTVEVVDVRIDQAVPTAALHILEQNLTVYPNPGKGIFQLEWQEVLPKELEARVINVVGATIVEFTIPMANRKTWINLENQSAGIYVLFIRDQNHYIARKIIIE